jgi:hypothetical protein
MIQFRCWFCNKRYVVSEEDIAQRITCTCTRLLKVPKRSHGNSRVKTAMDWLVEVLVFGLGGALLGFGLAVLILSQWPGSDLPFLFLDSWYFFATLTVLGFLAGLLGGERGVNWLGQRIRDRENR